MDDVTHLRMTTVDNIAHSEGVQQGKPQRKNIFYVRNEHYPAKNIDGSLLLVDAHLVIKNQVGTAERRSVVRYQSPPITVDIVHVEVALHEG